MSNQELLPCPFCGQLPKEYDQIAYSSVKCGPCGFSIKVKSIDGPPYAPELWNRRNPAVDDQQRLDFILSQSRRVCVERLPFNVLHIYVEEGFMGDVRYSEVIHKGCWKDAPQDDLRRQAIDLAIAEAANSGFSEAGQ